MGSTRKIENHRKKRTPDRKISVRGWVSDPSIPDKGSVIMHPIEDVTKLSCFDVHFRYMNLEGRVCALNSISNGDCLMPLIQVKLIEGVFTQAQKSQMIAKLT